MPHCIVEYSAAIEQQLQPAVLLSAIYQAAVKSALFTGNDIKTRAIAYNHAQLTEQHFIHVTLRILSGRSLSQRQLLSKLVLEHLIEFDLTEISITVEVVEIERATYQKHLA